MKTLIYPIVALLALSQAVHAEETRPNIILIMADDLGYGDLSGFGSKTIQTPHIDSVAKQGVKLTDFHSNGAVCSPTRAALMTGRYQQRSGVTGVITAKDHREKGLSLEEVTFAEVLSKAGYATGMFGKWHLGYDAAFNPTKQGFSEFKGFVSGNIDYHNHIDQAGFRDWWQKVELKDEPGYLTDLVTGHALDFIERHKEQPYCLYLAHGAPHYPLQGRKTPGFRTEGKPRVNVPVDDPKGIYKEMIEVMDEGVGRILAKLKEQGSLDNTLVIFCSDNGPAGSGSAGPLRGKKGQVWEGGHRVPGCVMWPAKIPGGRSVDETILCMDFFPTFLAAAGVLDADVPSLDGVNLLPSLIGDAAMPDRTLFWDTNQSWAARRGNWKVVANGKEIQLFNLLKDLGETEDLSEPFRGKKQELIDAHKAWKKETQAEAPVS
jgi:arylsulfatase A-like enzyme